MNFFKCLSLVVLLAVLSVNGEQFSYDGYRLIRLFPKTVEQLNLIANWENNEDFDIWGRIKNTEEAVTVLLSPVAFHKYTIAFGINQLAYTIIDNNIQNKIEEQARSMVDSRASGKASIVGKFAKYPEIQNYIDEIVNANSDIASSYIAGKTSESRNLKVLVLKKVSSQKKVWIDCGIHAREWISPATCVWIIDSLVNEKSNADSLLNKYEFHILPILNADGYDYSHNTNRLWRKNRSINPGSSCIGTDLNRNYGYQWMTGGSSNNPCSDTYAGSKADSELETKAVENSINAHKGTWAAFLTLHTYGQWWFTTWGYTTVKPSDFDNLNAKAKIGAEAIKAVYNDQKSPWVYGQSSTILYIASGGSEDWAQGNAGVPYAYCLELRPSQTGTDSNYGFTLPEDRVPKAGTETYVGIKAFLNAI
jgi:hypothetical protein